MRISSDPPVILNRSRTRDKNPTPQLDSHPNSFLPLLPLCASVSLCFKKSIRPRAIQCADFGNTESQSTRSLCPKTQSLPLCASVPLCFKKEYQTARHPLRGLRKHRESQSTRSLCPKTQSLFSLCLRVSVFQKKSIRPRAIHCADFGNTESHRVHGASVLKPKASLSVPPCLCVSKKEHQTARHPLRGLWKHRVTECTEPLS
jgi:hypothetical protein